MAALALIAAPLAAKPPNFAKVKISAASSERGAILFVAPVEFSDYVLWMSPLDPASRRPTSLHLMPVRPFKFVAMPPDKQMALVLKDVDPGEYVVRMVTTQGYWGACLSEKTVGFPVAPGKITYLGRVDPAPSLRTIMLEATRTGKMTSSGGQLRLFKENVEPPVFSLVDAPSAEGVLAAARANQLVTDAPVVAAPTAMTSFVRKDKSDLTGYCQ